MKIAMLALAAMALSAQTTDNTEAQVSYKPLKATYAIYSGPLHEKQAASRRDRKLAIAVTGPAAKDIFDSL